MWDGVGVVKIVFTSPYHRFCQATRPTLPTSLKNSERERLLGEMWKSLSKDGREAFKSGLVQQLNTGRGGIRAWQPAFDCSGTSPAAALDAWQPVLDPPAKRRATAEGAVRVGGGDEYELTASEYRRPSVCWIGVTVSLTLTLLASTLTLTCCRNAPRSAPGVPRRRGVPHSRVSDQPAE